jgi:hypothetical protein
MAMEARWYAQLPSPGMLFMPAVPSSADVFAGFFFGFFFGFFAGGGYKD